MKRSLVFWCFLLSLCPTLFAQLPGADCAFANTLVVNGACAVGVSLTNTTMEPGVVNTNICGSGQTAQREGWYIFQAINTTATVTVDAAARNATIQVFSGGCGALTEIACANAITTNGPQVETANVAGLIIGNFYYVRVGNITNNNMAINTVCITGPPGPPSNDDPCSAIPLTPSGICSYATYTNASATNTGGVPVPGCAGYSGGDVWFSVVVPAGGSLNFDTQTGVMLDGGMAVYSGTCAAMVLIACDDNTSANGNMPMISLTGQTPGNTLWIRIWENGNNNNGSFGICVVDPNAPPPAGAVYIGSTGGDPWFSNSNQVAMNTVFGATWTQAYFETLNVSAIFSASNCFIFMEGGDFTTTAFENFLNTNLPAIEAWVAAGGRLIINAAPNVGGNVNYGFGGVTLNYDGGTSLAWDGNASAGQAGHAIFNGPYLPCGTTFFGNYFAHAWISGGATISLMDYMPAPGPSLTEKAWGAGRVLFGGMTTSNWHTPWPETDNLIANIISYQSSCTPPLPIEMISFTGDCADNGSVLYWTTASETNNAEFIIESSTDGITYQVEGKVAGAGNSNVIKEYSYLSPLRAEPGNYFRLTQRDFNGTETKYAPLYISCDHGSNSNCAILNLNNDQIEWNVYSNKDEEITCTLMDVRGSILQTLQMKTTKGSNHVQISAEGLTSGVYIIMVVGSNHQCASKFLKK